MGWEASTSMRTPGKTEEIPWIRFDQISSRDSARQFAFLLSPFRAHDVALTAARISDRHFIVMSPGNTDHLYFSHGSYSDGTLKTDAEFVLVRMRKDAPPAYALIEGTYLVYEGKKVFTSPTTVSHEGEIGR
jgi:hypothetical protein